MRQFSPCASEAANSGLACLLELGGLFSGFLEEQRVVNRDARLARQRREKLHLIAVVAMLFAREKDQDSNDLSLANRGTPR
jgi:hypothetical protein